MQRIFVFLLSVCSLFAQSQPWQTTRTFRGTGAPAAGLCRGQIDVGTVYTDRSLGGRTYRCVVTAGGAFSWEKIASSSTDLSDTSGLVRGGASLTGSGALLRDARGNFRPQSAAAVKATWFGTAVLVGHKMPQHRRWLTWINFGIAAAFGAAAIHNWGQRPAQGSGEPLTPTSLRATVLLPQNLPLRRP